MASGLSLQTSWLIAASFFGAAAAGLPETYPSVSMRGIQGSVDMPLIGIGTWQYNDTVAEAAVSTAFSLGYRHVDTAFVYENQVGVGSALKKSGLGREEYFVTTKIPGGFNASATLATLDQCLTQLGLDYVDLMLLHFPAPKNPRLNKEQWLALEKWAKSGRARAIGISHYCRTDLDSLLTVATLPVAIAQNQYHVGMAQDSQPRLHDKKYMEGKGILFESYSSLCGPCPAPDNMELITGHLVTSIGAAHKKSGAQVALRWLVQQGIPVIPKSASSAHIKSNFEIFDFKLTEAEMSQLSAATSPPETGTPQHPDDAQDCSAERRDASEASVNFV